MKTAARACRWVVVVLVAACGGPASGPTRPGIEGATISGSVKLGRSEELNLSSTSQRLAPGGDPAQDPSEEAVALPAEFVPGELLVAVNPGLDEGSVGALTRLIGYGAPQITHVAGRWFLVQLSRGGAPGEEETRAIAATLGRRVGIEAVELNYVARASLTPDDPLLKRQWYVKALELTKAWDESTGDDAVIAVIDTGITNHPELAGRTVRGYDFILDPKRALDGDGRDAIAEDTGGDQPRGNSSWHGTRVAGVIAARGNDGKGMAGVTWNARVQPVRVLGKGGGTLADIAAGIEWASGGTVRGVPKNATPARVLNLSLGALTGFCPAIFRDVIDDAAGRDAILVVAAGNESVDVKQSTPANCRGVISVAGTDLKGQLAPYSNHGDASVAAFGGDMAHDLDNDGAPDGILAPAFSPDGRPDFEYVEGTSLAAPQITGVVALMLSVNPKLSGREVLQRLQSGATPCLKWCGGGVVSAARALANARRPSTRTPKGLVVQGVDLKEARRGKLLVTNSGAAPAQVLIEADAGSRVSVLGSTSVAVLPGEQAAIEIGVSVNGLEPGIHRRQVTLASDDVRQVVFVEFTVGEELEDRPVEVRAMCRVSGKWHLAASTWTSLSGARFTIPGLPPGDYTLMASADDDGDGHAFGPGDLPSAPVQLLLRPGATEERELLLGSSR